MRRTPRVTVTGLITRNGTLAEAYTYDAYGNVSLWGYRPMDFSRGDRSERERPVTGRASMDACVRAATCPEGASMTRATGGGDVDGLGCANLPTKNKCPKPTTGQLRKSGVAYHALKGMMVGNKYCGVKHYIDEPYYPSRRIPPGG